MIEDVFEPLTTYRDHLREEHARNTADFFETLVKRSGVDEDANRALITNIEDLKSIIEKAEKRLKLWQRFRRFLIFVSVSSAVIAAVTLLAFFQEDFSHKRVAATLFFLVFLFVSVALCLLIKRKISPNVQRLDAKLSDFGEELEQTEHDAWTQMGPLNELYDWDIAPLLVSKSLPRLSFDRFFSRGRLSQLSNNFGWNGSVDKNRSILFAHSGEINGNPFIIGESLDFNMSEKTYHGQLNISWREQRTYTDAKGRRRTEWVTRHQTLHASVTKPCPEHTRHKFLLYGNEAAPDLRFSRTPSEFSHLKDGFFSKLQRRKELNRLKKFSRNLDDEYGYTLMANHDFELLFKAMDRSDEVQFRLLFTPLAQHQMVALLKDTEIGFGDDFVFIKSGMINHIFPTHLRDLRIDAHPGLFHSNDLGAARKFFNHFHNEYFKAVYFAFAPLLAIPLYQQHRSFEDIYKTVFSKQASSLEHESIANSYGYKHFAHPDSITPSILKTTVPKTDSDEYSIDVIAHGFSGKGRVDYVSKMGGDGRVHDVPVNWTEYTPVRRFTPVMLRECEDPVNSLDKDDGTKKTNFQEFYEKWQEEKNLIGLRRSIAHFVKMNR